MTRKLLHEYMSEAMAEVDREEKEKQNMDRLYAILILKNKILFCERSYAAIAFPMSELKESRQRMTKEIAEELIAQHGPMAALHCLERLANNTPQPQMWRDVMTWITELQGESDVNDGL